MTILNGGGGDGDGDGGGVGDGDGGDGSDALIVQMGRCWQSLPMQCHHNQSARLSPKMITIIMITVTQKVKSERKRETWTWTSQSYTCVQTKSESNKLVVDIYLGRLLYSGYIHSLKKVIKNEKVESDIMLRKWKLTQPGQPVWCQWLESEKAKVEVKK